MSRSIFSPFLLLVLFTCTTLVIGSCKTDFIVDFCVDHVKVKHAVMFSCFDNKNETFEMIEAFVGHRIFIKSFILNGKIDFVDLVGILTRHLAVSTCVVLGLSCPNADQVIEKASNHGYFNKSYQWLLLDYENISLNRFKNVTKKIGLNAQVTYVNSSSEEAFVLYDLHSKGQHLKSPLIVTEYGTWRVDRKFNIFLPLNNVQGVTSRRHFDGVTLRGVVVIDRDDISPEQVDDILSNPEKMAGISPFSKYHHSLVKILQQYYNFSVNYRITHGWAGRLPGSIFRLGLLGVVQRNEADIAATAAFNRINRFAEFDTIHQSWKFEAAFLYRITADLKDSSNGGGSFLSPFDRDTWIVGFMSLVVMSFIWKILMILEKRRTKSTSQDCSVTVNAFGVVCQQGLAQTPTRSSTRIVVYALLMFSLLMYNFYTSSVVGGLLSSKAKGPQNLSELLDSPLVLSFEDIGYHKVIFRETNSSLLQNMYHTKVQPYRNPNQLPAYTTVKDAVPYLKSGRYAFHCEMIDAYPEIAKLFDANEICDLRSVAGLFDIQIMNMILTKRSIYTELFRIALHRAREIGLIRRELTAHRPEKPRCQSGFTVHSVTLNGVMNAFVILGVGAFISVGVLFVEFVVKRLDKWKMK